MSEFYLKYHEVNQEKNRLIHSSHTMDRLNLSFHIVVSGLAGQKGLGVEEIRKQIRALGKKCALVADDLSDMGRFLEKLIKETEKADYDAAKTLKDFSIRQTENAAQIARKIFKDLMSLLLAWLGGIFAGNVAVEWACNLADAVNDAGDQNNLGDAAVEFIKSIAQSLLGSGLKDGLGDIGGKATAGWAVDLIQDGVENFTDGEGNFGEDVMETLSEALAGAAVYGAAAVAAALVISLLGLAGGGAGAAVVGVGVTIAVKWAADFLSEQFFHNKEGFVENAGDGICNWREQVLGF